jgi:protein-L-isoaspartate O-methyltransferase
MVPTLIRYVPSGQIGEAIFPLAFVFSNVTVLPSALVNKTETPGRVIIPLESENTVPATRYVEWQEKQFSPG